MSHVYVDTSCERDHLVSGGREGFSGQLGLEEGVRLASQVSDGRREGARFQMGPRREGEPMPELMPELLAYR